MKYDSMTREQAIELLRDLMEALDGLDASLLADQNVARTAAMSALVVDHEPSPLPVAAGEDLDHHQAHTHEVALRIIRGNDQARRVIRLVQWRTLRHAEKLGVL
jgi:hypothetical protein